MRWNLKLRRTAPGRIGLVVAAWALGVALIPSVSQAAVEYVKICDPLLYGNEYHYLPGSDTCHNASKYGHTRPVVDKMCYFREL